jgi:RNA polymerase sigma-70 factor (ECF subfamily)
VQEPANLNQLMAALARGDRSAFTPVFQLLWSPVRKLCLSLLSNSADAEDAAQTAMEKILARASEYDVTRPALPWALGIAAWQCRTERRKVQRRKEVPDQEATAPDQSVGGGESEIVERDLVAAALNALGELSELDQQTLLATFADNADLAGASGATLRKRRERALTRLRAGFRRLYGLD